MTAWVEEVKEKTQAGSQVWALMETSVRNKGKSQEKPDVRGR